MVQSGAHIKTGFGIMDNEKVWLRVLISVILVLSFVAMQRHKASVGGNEKESKTVSPDLTKTATDVIRTLILITIM